MNTDIQNVPDPSVEIMPTEDTPAVIDFDELVANVNKLNRDHTLGFALAVGELIVNRLYGGDIGYLRQKGPKEHSLRTLASRKDLCMSASSIYNTVGVYEIYERLNRPDWTHLGFTHFLSVLSLPNDKQQQMLSKANRYRWTVTNVRKRVQQIRKNTDDKRGRPCLPQYQKDMNSFMGTVENDGFFDGCTEENVKKLGPRHTTQYLATIESLQRQLSTLEDMLKATQE